MYEYVLRQKRRGDFPERDMFASEGEEKGKEEKKRKEKRERERDFLKNDKLYCTVNRLPAADRSLGPCICLH